MIQVKSAAAAGFCFGVRRAVEAAYREAEGSPGIIYTYGELIHNPQEVSRLKERGILPAETAEEVTGDRVILRTHGVGRGIIEQFQEKGKQILDLTCPYVKKIHQIAADHSRQGFTVVIVGDAAHPEVEGIRGWCEGESFVIRSAEEITPELADTLKERDLCLVSQTTLNHKTWEDVTDALERELGETGHALLKFDTICSATNQRQAAAVELAQEADVMIVIGGRHSSNTRKLYEVCSAYCPRTYHIEDANEVFQIREELPNIDKKNILVGITAGASTPDHIIKEVINTMEKQDNLNNQEELSFAEAFEQSLVTLATGQTVKGVVLEVTPTEVIVDLGFKSDGVIPRSELTDDPDAKPSDLVKVGEEIEVFVVRVNDSEGQVTLSKKKLEQAKNWETIKEAFENQTILNGRVVDVVPSGVIVFTTGSKVFVPASQAAERYMADLSVLKGQEVSLRIIDMNERRRKVVGSIKSVAKEVSQKVRDEFFATAKEGDRFEGTVKSVTDFGAFVDVGGVDGLVHVSELSWKKVGNPKDLVKVGDKLDVYVKSIDQEKGKISLGHKDPNENPWEKFTAKYNVGDIANGTVVRLVPFGAFVDIDGVDGLIHISELSWKSIKHPSEVLKVDQVVEVTIKDIDMENKKVSLGYKKVEDNPWEIFKSKYTVGDVVTCKVVRIVAFGAFAEIIDGVDGLIHISQIVPDRRINTVTEVLNVGDEVQAKITDIKLDSGKVSLSIKALAEPETPAEAEAAEEEEEVFEMPQEEPGKTALEEALEAASAPEVSADTDAETAE